MRRKTARKIEPHIAALRRHARSVSGDGGGLADRVLQSVRGKDYRDLPARDVRARLFRDFHDAHASSVASSDRDAQQDRHGLMLRHAQGFSIQDAAAILRCDVLELQGRLERAYAGLHGKAGMDVLLIEDDPVLAQGMIDIIESLGHRVLGVARDKDEALSTAKSIRLDAVVADIFDDASAAAPEWRAKPMDRLLGKTDTRIVMVTPDMDNADDPGHRRPAYLVATPFQAAELKVVLSQALRDRA